MKRALVFFAACAVVSAAIAHGADTAIVTAQLLDYEKGYVFFTTGDGFRVASNVTIVDRKTGAPAGPPQARQYARVTFDSTGTVTKIELSRTALPPEGDLNAVRRFAVALSSPQPNPDLGPQAPAAGCARVVAGHHVTLTVNVVVPPSTRLTDTVYMTTDQSGWSPLAYRLDRVDALHYRMQMSLLSGTVLHYLFDRGSSQSIQLAENGIEQKPFQLCVGDADAQAVARQVYHWGDEALGVSLPQPQTMPTPYNPAPFPNLPTPQPFPTKTP